LTLTLVSAPCELEVLDTTTVTSVSSLLLLASLPSAGSNEDYIKQNINEQ